MKIGLYLQDNRKNTKKEFYRVISPIKEKKILILLVFPESSYIPTEKRCINGNIFDSKIRRCV